MKADARGRVRFTYKNVRFELSKNGIRTYARYTRWNGKEVEVAEAYADSTQSVFLSFADPEFRNKLYEALECLAYREQGQKESSIFTKDIFIPKHMRAV